MTSMAGQPAIQQDHLCVRCVGQLPYAVTEHWLTLTSPHTAVCQQENQDLAQEMQLRFGVATAKHSRSDSSQSNGSNSAHHVHE